MPTVTIAITSGTRWRVPVDCTSATIHCIGGGGGGGGAYSKSTGVSLTPLSLAYVNIGVDGGDTWFNKTTNSAPTSNTNGALAKGGATTAGCCDPILLGGQAVDGVGDVDAKFSGGNGIRNITCGGTVYEIGGGAAGPSGAGGNAGETKYLGGGGGGGGANGGTNGTNGSSVTGNGGTGGNSGVGGAGGAGGLGSTSSGTAGSPGTNGGGGGGGGADTVVPFVAVNNGGGAGSMQAVWTDYLGNSYGPAGGSGGEPYSNIDLVRTITQRTNYGGGGALSGGQGLIIITYTPVVTIGNSYTEVLNETGSTEISTPSRWRIPYGVDSVNVHAIGSGSAGQTPTGPWGGGGGGAYANSTIDVSTLNNTGAYYLNYFTGSFFGGSDAWFNKSANTAPSANANGVLAKGAAVGSRTGGASASSVGVTVYSGGTGGSGGGTTIVKSGGGGGAAGPSGAGKNGGNVFSATNASGSSGGGGGANGGSSTAGTNSPAAATAGAGGAGNGGTGGGAAATASSAAGNGTNGGGGGGGKNTVGFLNGGDGSTQNIWTDSGTSSQYGPGGGGGGAAATNSSNLGNGGAGGNWGGGSSNRTPVGYPLIVLQYTIVKAVPVDAIVTSGNMFMMFN